MFVIKVLQKMQKLALFCNWREIKSVVQIEMRVERLLRLVIFIFGEFCLSVDNACVLCFVPFSLYPI